MEAGTQFIGVKPGINMQERKSNVANNPTDVFTIEEIRGGYKSFVGYFTTYTSVVSYESLTIGDKYVIVEETETSDFTGVGAANNHVGTEFTATGANPNWGDEPYPILIDLDQSVYDIQGNFNSLDFTPEFTTDIFTYPSKTLIGIYFPYEVDYRKIFVNIPLFNDSAVSFYLGTNHGDIEISSGNFFDQPIEIRLYE